MRRWAAQVSTDPLGSEPEAEIDVAEWQRRLEDTFDRGGVVGASLLPIMQAELAYRDFATTTFRGYHVLTDSFLSFFADSLSEAERQYATSSLRGSLRWYPQNILSHTSNFRRFRAAEIVFLYGYPLSAFALARDLKDNALSLAAVASGRSTFAKFSGLGGVADKAELDESDWKAILAARKAEEQRIHAVTLAALESPHKAELQLWEQLFHVEVHGSRFTYAFEGKPWLTGEAPLPVAPRQDPTVAAMYLNRSNEIGWLHLRLLPMLQLHAGAFGSRWAAQWRVLDESFRFAVESLTKDLGKPIGAAVSHLVDTLFAFQPESTNHIDS